MDPSAANRTAWLIWGSMLQSQVIFVGIGLYLVWTGGIEPTEGSEVIKWVLVGVGLLVGAASFAVGRFMSAADFQTVSIVRWAFCEAACLMGFVACFLSGSVGLLLGMFGYAIALLALHAPTAGARSAWEDELS